MKIYILDLGCGNKKRAIVYFANKRPLRYERFLSQLIPLNEINYYLEKV